MNISLIMAGILSISLLGTLLCFTYRWSDRNPLISPIVSADGSVWEHMKLLFFPMFLFGLWSLKGKIGACRILAFHAGLLMGTLLMPVLYYSYISALGHSTLTMNITIFYICVTTAFFIYCGLPGSCLLEKYSHAVSMAVFLLSICFLLFTYLPLGSSTFKDPEG